jgi:hypothetical protein
MARKSIFRDLDTRCGGTGWLECSCGGDQCYCQLNGGIDCSGCPDCEGQSDENDDYPDPLYEPDCDQCGGPTCEGFCRTCQA